MEIGSKQGYQGDWEHERREGGWPSNWTVDDIEAKVRSYVFGGGGPGAGEGKHAEVAHWGFGWCQGR